MLTFQDARFVTSALLPGEFPTVRSPQGALLPEMALAGRSNVGKSSLINSLLQDSKLAKTSSRPGKTQRILFFEVDEQALLVDLPGYGFAKAPKAIVREWSEAIDQYLRHAERLRLLLLLVDGRRDLSSGDQALQAWAESRGIACVLVFTKSDKLTAREKQAYEGRGILFSTEDPGARRGLIREINRVLA